jgi:hypothetical protein
MKPQEIFNTVAKHLFKQGKRSVDERFCRYHNNDGLKCAVGILVSEEEYFPEMDMGNKTIKTLLQHHEDKFPTWMKENLGLVQALQSVHDKQNNWESSDNMYNALVEVASAYDVSPDILEEIDFEEEEVNYGK